MPSDRWTSGQRHDESWVDPETLGEALDELYRRVQREREPLAMAWEEVRQALVEDEDEERLARA